MSLWFPSSVRAAEPTYWQDVRPLLRKHCTACHNARSVGEPDVSGGVALDSLDAILKGGKRAIVRPGRASESSLVSLLLETNEEKRMPLAAPALSAESVAVMRRWIDAGAKEGTKPKEDAPLAVAASPPRTRKRDVTLTTSAVPPRGVFGDLPPSRLELSLAAGPLAPVAAVAFSPDGKHLVTGSYGFAVVWDLTTVRPTKVLTNVLGAVNDVRFSPDGKLLALAGGQPSAKGDVRLVAVGTWAPVATLSGHQDVVFSVAFSPDGKRLASASFDKTVRIWDIATHKTTQTLTGQSDFVYSVAFSPDGTWLAAASKDRTVKVVDTATGKSRFTLGGFNDDVLAVAVAPDGKGLVSAGFEPALVWWNPATGERVRSQGGHGVAVHEIVFSRDGSTLATAGGDRTLRLWRGTGGAALRTIAVGSVVYAAALSPDGKRVASGSADGLTRLWDVATGRPLLTLLLTLSPRGGASDWLALTPEGYIARSDAVAAEGRWTMGGKGITATAAWQALTKPDAVAAAARGEAVKAPTFAK